MPARIHNTVRHSFLRDRGTIPLIAILGGANGLIIYTTYKHLRYNPDVQVRPTVRSTEALRKEELLRDKTEKWWDMHQSHYRNVHDDVSKISIFEVFSPSYWSARRAAQRDPEHLTASGRDASVQLG